MYAITLLTFDANDYSSKQKRNRRKSLLSINSLLISNYLTRFKTEDFELFKEEINYMTPVVMFFEMISLLSPETQQVVLGDYFIPDVYAKRLPKTLRLVKTFAGKLENDIKNHIQRPKRQNMPINLKKVEVKLKYRALKSGLFPVHIAVIEKEGSPDEDGSDFLVGLIEIDCDTTFSEEVEAEEDNSAESIQVDTKSVQKPLEPDFSFLDEKLDEISSKERVNKQEPVRTYGELKRIEEFKMKLYNHYYPDYKIIRIKREDILKNSREIRVHLLQHLFFDYDEN
jgi:hypothetical protein